MKTTRSNTSLLILFNYIAMVLVWGSFPVAARIGVEHAPPLLLSGVRFSIAFAIMAPLALLQRKKLLITSRQHLQVFLIALLMVAIPSSIFFVSTLYALPTLILLFQASP
jgi:drug/metabolite transporter (DMT)-like permease